jgi:MFS family permease
MDAPSPEPVPEPSMPPAVPPGPPATGVKTDEVPPPPPTRGGAPMWALEILGYAGAAAALAATSVAFDASSTTAQVVIGLSVTVALVVFGWLVGTRDEALERMRSVFWFGAVLSWVTVVGVLVGPDGMDLRDKWVLVLGATFTAVLALPLWLRERRSLQLIAAFVSVHLALAALVYTTTTESFFGYEQEVPNLRWSALVTVLFGVGGLVLGMREVLRPRRTAMVLGALALLLGLPLLVTDFTDLAGAAAFGGSPSIWPFLATIVAGVIVLLVGRLAGVLAVIGLGILGLIVGVVQLVDAKVHDDGPAFAVLVAGLVIVAAVAFLARSGGGAAPPSAPPAPGDAT